MQRILSRAKQIKPKHAALLLAVAAAVAAIVYFTGRETQVEQRIAADQAFDDLIESFGQPPTIVRSSE